MAENKDELIEDGAAEVAEEVVDVAEDAVEKAAGEAADAVRAAEEAAEGVVEEAEEATKEPDDAEDEPAADDGLADEPEEDKAPADEPASGKGDAKEHAPKKSVRKAAAKKAAAKRAEESKGYTPKPAKQGVSGGVLALVGALCLVAGLLLGHFLPLGGGTAGGDNQVAGLTSLAEDQLDTAVGSYVTNGETRAITAREVITSMSTLEEYVGDDGTYAVPSADSVLSYVRNQVLNDAVAAEGITVSDADVAAYAEEILGSSDLELIAEQYGMDVETATQMIRESAGVRALYDQVVSVTDLEPPVAPATPEEGEEDTPTAEYGAYVIDLVGDEWDADANTWASQDGPYYAALSMEDFSADAATYNQAVSAYYVAYQVYATEYTNVTSRWTEYVNDLFANSSVDIYSLVS